MSTDAVCRSCGNSGYDVANKPCSCGIAEEITTAWLAAHGWRACRRRGDGAETNRRQIGDDVRGGRPPFGASDDLCIDVSPGTDGTWFVWVFQAEPYRHIHVRHMRYVWELVRLYEGLTGVRFRAPRKAGAAYDLTARD